MGAGRGTSTGTRTSSGCRGGAGGGVAVGGDAALHTPSCLLGWCVVRVHYRPYQSTRTRANRHKDTDQEAEGRVRPGWVPGALVPEASPVRQAAEHGSAHQHPGHVDGLSQVPEGAGLAHQVPLRGTGRRLSRGLGSSNPRRPPAPTLRPAPPSRWWRGRRCGHRPSRPGSSPWRPRAPRRWGSGGPTEAP